MRRDRTNASKSAHSADATLRMADGRPEILNLVTAENLVMIGYWEPETILQRAERARVFLAIMGFLTPSEWVRVEKRLTRERRRK